MINAHERDQAIALQPDNANYFDHRGNIWRDRGRFERAIEDYDKALMLAPDFAFAFYNRAQAQYLAGRFSLRGLIQEKLGARDLAIADLRRATELNPGLRQPAEALLRLGVTAKPN